jgi:hypothetical protein
MGTEMGMGMGMRGEWCGERSCRVVALIGRG